ncbi:DPP IV N-terminal domain-containing protein [Ulvibacterium sp.]|uniref:DPP IV N-terminal domain-containing protein n=1 Tax=Ulvibacterium sp. TaxID=2665914 RepID=UPI003BAD2B80
MKNYIKIVLLALLSFGLNSCKKTSSTIIRYTVPEYWDYQPTWSHDGEKIVFASTRNSHPTQNLFRINVDGSDAQQLTFNQKGWGNSFPSCSPDGTKIAFISDQGDGIRSLFIMSTDGSDIQMLSQEEDVLSTQVVFSPDSEHIYAEVQNENGSDIYSFHVGTGKKSRVTFFDWGVANPSLHPNGKQLAFNSGRYGNPEIEVLNLETGMVERITESWSDDGAPVWSADGKHIYFYSNKDEPKYEIYSIEVTTKKWKRITDSPNWDLEARVSPNGRHLTFHSSRIGRNSIVVTDLEGNNRKTLTNLEVTPFIDLIEEDGLKSAIAAYPNDVLDSLATQYVFEEELLGLADELIKTNRNAEAKEVLDYIGKDVNTEHFPDMTAEYYQKLNLEAPLSQSQFFRLVLDKGVEKGRTVFNELREKYKDWIFLNDYEMLMFAYWYHFQGRYESSIDLLHMNLELYPRSHQTYHDLGQSYEANGELETAFEYYKKASELDTISWYGTHSKSKMEELGGRVGYTTEPTK